MSAPLTPLPLPVARLRRRSHNAKSPKDRHDTAYFAWEVSLRLGVAAHPPADPAQLARASVGQWAGALRVHEEPMQDARILALFARLTEVGTDKRSERRSLTPRDLMNALPAYRNRVIGHSSARAASFYEEAGAELLAALDAAWEAGLFLPADAELVFAETVQLASDGTPRARLLRLAGDAPTVIDPRGSVVPEGILPHRLYLRRGERWTSLHPWLVFEEESERLLCFNGLGRRAEYLDYGSGETLAGAELEKRFPGVTDELRELFSAPAEGAEPPTPVEDARFFGDYEVLGKIGQGGMGAVYLARQKSLERLVALKMLPAERAHDAVAVARFKREIDALGRCEHANVIKILACGEARGTHFYAMEYVEGADLARVAGALSSSGSDFDTAISSACEAVRGERKELFEGLPQVERRAQTPHRGRDRYKQAARLFAGAARGLAHLHANGIVHRDISPANIMVTWPDERAVIMDLGLAGVENASVSLTKDDRQILGTLRYIAPEQLQRSLLSVDRRADIWSIGTTLYELLADRPMWDGETEARLIEQVIREEPPPLDKVAPKVPRDLALIVHKATEKDPKLRYDTADALADDLERYLAGEPVAARPPTIGYLISKWVGKHKELTAAAAAALVLLAGTVAWFVVRLEEKKRFAEERTREVLELSALPDLINLEQEARSLWPISDTLVLQRAEDWLRRAQELRDGTSERPGLAGFRAQRDELRASGRELSAAEKAERERRDFRYESLERRRKLVELWSVVRQRRSGATVLQEPESWQQDVDWHRLPRDWSGLNRRAWHMASWTERREGTDDHLALQIARKALEEVRKADSESASKHAWEVLDTLAWALFRNGLDDQARIESQRAYAGAPDDRRVDLQDSRSRLDEEIQKERSTEAKAALSKKIEDTLAEIQATEDELTWFTDWRFESTLDQKRHDYLTVLVSRMVRFFDPKRGLFEGAETVGQLSVTHLAHWSRTARGWLEDDALRRRWKDAHDAIAEDEARYRGLQLEAQFGLLPIGRNESTGLWEFLMPLAPRSADVSHPASTRSALDDGLILVLVPGGKFTMGLQNTDPTGDNYEEPAEDGKGPSNQDEYRENGDAIEVDLAPYFLSKFEMTHAQWKRIAGSNPSLLRPGNTAAGVKITDQHPVNNVSWEQATRLFERIGLVLPTEAQWERAGLAGAAWTPELMLEIERRGNTADSSMRRDSKLTSLDSIDDSIDDAWPVHAPVGTFEPNAWGLCDMQGNVWEWCRDAYGSYDEPTAPETGERLPYSKSHHVLRGGGCFESPVEARIPRRNYDEPKYRSISTGVRPARLIVSSSPPTKR